MSFSVWIYIIKIRFIRIYRIIYIFRLQAVNFLIALFLHVKKMKGQPMTVYAYLRVSTLEQDTEKNKLEILKFANDKRLGNVEFIEEKVTGKLHFRKRELGLLIEKMGVDDVLIVPELSRLARSITQILEILNLSKEKGFVLYSLKENFASNDKSITAVITSTIFALVAQLERDLISLRTKEALQAKKASGVKLGRPKGKKGKSKLDVYRKKILYLVGLNVPKTVIARECDTTVGNLYNYLKTV